MHRLQSLIISYCFNLTTVGFCDICKLTTLKTLELGNTKIRHLYHISFLAKLQRLYLMKACISESEFSHISTLQQLTYLNIGLCVTLNNAALKSIGKLEYLTHLNILSTPITDVGFEYLCDQFRALRWLNLSGSKVECLGCIWKLKDIETLFIGNTRCKDFSVFGSLLNLTLLNISCCHEMIVDNQVVARMNPLVKIIS